MNVPAFRSGLVVVLSAALTQPPVAPPQPDGIVAVVSSSATETSREAVSSFRRRLEQRGVRVAVEVNLSSGEERANVAALQSARATVILAVGARAAEVAQREQGQAVVVSTMVLKTGDVAAGRGTGVALEFPIDQQLDWIRRILPNSARRVGIVFNPAENARTISRIREAAGARGLEIVARPVSTPADIPQALASLTGTADVLWGVPDDVVMTPETARSILLFSMRNRLPLIGLSSAWVRAGALFALDRDYADMGTQCADQVLRLLQGEPVSAVPPEHPRRIEYSVNQRTADLMNIRLSQETLRNAKEVVR